MREDKIFFEDKTIKSLFPVSKRTRLENLLNLAEGSSVEDAAPRLYALQANKKERQTRLSIVQQDVDDFAISLGVKAPLIPFGCVSAIVELRLQGLDESDLGSGICPMVSVPPSARSAKAIVDILYIEQNSQNASHIGNGNF